VHGKPALGERHPAVVLEEQITPRLPRYGNCGAAHPQRDESPQPARRLTRLKPPSAGFMTYCQIVRVQERCASSVS
jgi:hypothetical protein